MDPVPSAMVDGDGGGMQEHNGGNTSDEASTSDVSHNEVGEQATREPQDAPQVWWLAKEQQPSRMYSVNIL